MNDVYINSLAAFLPNEPVKSDDIERYLGEVSVGNRRMKSLRDRIIRINGIETRHYALDSNGNPTHLSEEMCEIAGMEAVSRSGYTLEDIDLVSFGTSHSDLLVPSLTHMVMGRLGKHGLGPTTIAPTSGVCLSSIFSMKNAELAIKTGEKKVALIGGCERPSVTMRSNHYYEEAAQIAENKKVSKNYNFVHTAFLRWMLSDGCGAAIVSDSPNKNGLSLKVDWIEITSYANELPTCMYSGTNAPGDFLPTDTFWAQESLDEAAKKGMVVLRQDPRILSEHIADATTWEVLRLIKSGKLVTEDIRWFLPHISSFGFKPELQARIEEHGMDLGEEKWFTNLAHKGNTGAAAAFIMLEEAFHEGMFAKGDKILLLVPESARFSVGVIQLTCV